MSGFAIHNPDPAINNANWLNCQAVINAMGLSREFTNHSQKVIFKTWRSKSLTSALSLCSMQSQWHYISISPPTPVMPQVFSQDSFTGKSCTSTNSAPKSTDINIELGAFYCRLLA
jgi:hypothetical protein